MSIRIYYLLAMILVGLSASAQNILKGRVKSAVNNEPIAFAGIYIKETGKGTVADVEGRYSLKLDNAKDCHIMVSSMGYRTTEFLVKARTATLDFVLNELSVALDEFTVTATYPDKMGSDATIGQEALEYIQPTSLKDIFTLLPGGKIGSVNMQSSSLISSRQAGADLSTSFGMGLTVNGVPVRNDGMRIQMSGLVGQHTMDAEGNVSVNAGMDLRTISTDHIESVTVTRGISSAKEGNLSSGAIKINVKQGTSPMHARVKFDPQNKLAYVGKGVKLSDALGTLYLGADIVRSQAQIEDSRGAYNRVSGQVNWNNQKKWWGKTVHMNVMGSYVTSFSNNKTDEMINAYHEKYNSSYQRSMLSAKLKMELNEPWADALEFIFSGDYTQSTLKHHKHVINRGVMPLQKSKEEGESEGFYLPSFYDTYYKIENLPLNVFSQLTAQKFGAIGESWNYDILLGTSVNYTKNFGAGAVSDPLRPPFPSADHIRPRKNSDIPALVNQAGFLETKLRYRHGLHELNTSLGMREAMMLNLPSSYLLNGKLLWEPRLQASYTFYHNIGRRKMNHTLRVGYGVEQKLPSADYLYPDKVYHDYIALNAYFTDEANRLLLTNTKIQNPTNEKLGANKNRKIELGYDLKYEGYELSITAFSERMKGGVEYFTTYTPARYTYYYELKHPIAGKPTKDDFHAREMRTFMALRVPTNSAKIEKRGIEYRLRIPSIEAIKSEVEINGAYYHTIYSNGVPVMYHPSFMIEEQIYPYVGIFEGFEKQYASNFNTNLWVNTHLPKWKLIFTNFIQTLWFQKSRLGTDVDEYPAHYMDTDGVVHKFDIGNDAQLERLRRRFQSARYNENKLPVSLAWNIKATKEFSRNVKLSFFANNIIQLSPKYRNAYYQTLRNRRKPFFGAELTMTL